MDWKDYLAEFEADWIISGKAPETAQTYVAKLSLLPDELPTLASVKLWIAAADSPTKAQWQARAIRAFGKWSQANEGPPLPWWSRVPSVQVEVTPQATVTEAVYQRTFNSTAGRERLLVELLWCTGMRFSEIARLEWDHLDLDQRFAIVVRSKSRRPRVVPLSDQACRLARRHGRREGPLLGVGQHGLRSLLRRMQNMPTPHAFRRGWAVHSLRSGVSQTSVQAAGGWSSGAMVSRYTSQLAGELAIDEFRRTFR